MKRLFKIEMLKNLVMIFCIRSLDNIEEFWNLVWDDANIIGTKGKSIINDYNDLIKSKFFQKDA